MTSKYLTAEQAIEKANEFFDKREFNQALQYFEYANRIKPNDQSDVGIILINLITTKDLQNAMKRASFLPTIRYSREALFKVYRAIVAQYYYTPRVLNIIIENEAISLNVTRCFIERYLTNSYENLQKQIGEGNANTIRLMLLKVLLQSYDNILEGHVWVGDEQLPDTYKAKTEGTTWNYGNLSETKVNTTIETQKNSRSIYMRTINFIGESKNELNFQLRCKDILDEIHKVDPNYSAKANTSIPNLNYLLGGYLKYKTHKKMKAAAKRKSIFSGLIFFSGFGSILLTLIKQVAVEVTAFLTVFRIIWAAVLVMSIIFYFKERSNVRKYKKGEYEIDEENIKKNKAHSNL